MNHPKKNNTQALAAPALAKRRAGLKWLALAGMGCAVAWPAAQAQSADWPNKPVRVVIPFSSGGATDLLGRALGNELGKIWKQSVVIDNRTGAGGAVAAELVAKAPADGYTLLLASGSMFTVNPHLYPKLPYSLQSFELIGKTASGPMVVTINSAVPANNFKEFVAYAKANPGKLNMASAGNGSQVHIAGEAFAQASGIDVTHVPYKGEGPAYADLMGGAVQMAVGNINAISPLLKSGRVKALAVTGRERSGLMPEVPTVVEAGLPNFEFTGWFALVAPAGTPKALTAKIYADIQQAMEQPGMKRYLAEQGMLASVVGPAQLTDDINRESARWKDLVAVRKITAN